MDTEKRCAKIVHWLKEQVRLSGGAGSVFGLSGGIDSSVVAGLCIRAFGQNCLGVIMPCFSQESDARHGELAAKAFKLPYVTVSLDDPYRALLAEMDVKEGAQNDCNLAIANIKPRLRMTVLYYYAAMHHYRVIGTGNKSEIYIGYFTKYGDGGVDLEPLGELTKGEVRQLAEYLGVPREIINKKPTAGLWEGQTDEDEMGFSYAELDAFLAGEPVDPEVRETIERLHNQSHHKRMLPPIYEKKA